MFTEGTELTGFNTEKRSERRRTEKSIGIKMGSVLLMSALETACTARSADPYAGLRPACRQSAA
jgi:hypothetical protein